MPAYTYTAMDARGRELRGQLEAETEQDATDKLRLGGLFPTSMVPVKSAGAKAAATGRITAGATAAHTPVRGFNLILGQSVIKRRQLAEFTRQLATLLDAGLPLVRALRTLARQARSDHALQRILGEVATAVEGGSTFSEALGQHPRSFNKLYVNMIRAGEAAGVLATALTRLAEFMEKAQRISGKVKSAMVYPVMVLVIAVLITSGLMIFIVPRFAQMFTEMLPGQSLPPLTRLVVAISAFMRDHALVMAGGAVAAAVAFKLARRTPAGAFALDYLAVTLPPFNQLAVRTSVARFCRTLGTLTQSGVSILQALQITKDTAGNELVARAVQTVHDAVKEGEGMSRPMEQARVFPGMVVSMVEVGEQTGALPEMLNRIADVYEEQVDRAVEGLTALIEPIMIVFLAIVVGGIVIAMFLPLIKIMIVLGGPAG